MAESFNAVVLDPDEGARARLKTATDSVDDFETVLGAGNDRDAIRYTERFERVDLVFVSEKVPQEKIRNFIESVKRLPNCVTTVFILIKSSNAGGVSASDALLLGADGVLCEPFSVDGLIEVVDLASRLGREREAIKTRITLTLLATDAISQLDAAAYLMINGCTPNALRRSMRELTQKVRAASAGDGEDFHEILLRLIEKAPPMNGKLATKIYKGASNRVRRNTEIKLWKEIATIHNREEEK